MRMEIRNQWAASQQNGQAWKPREGDIVKATIKEKTSANEATVSIRGREFQAVFSDKVPANGERVQLQIGAIQNDNQIRVTQVQEDNSKSEATKEEKTNARGNQPSVQPVSSEVKQAVQVLQDKGIPLTKEGIKALSEFFQQASGTNAEKLDTVTAIAAKHLDVTSDHLRSVHETLHGRHVHEVMKDLVKSIDPAAIQREAGSRGAQADRMIQEFSQGLKNGAFTEQNRESVEKALQDARAQQDASRAHIQQAMKQVMQSANRTINDIIQANSHNLMTEEDMESLIQQLKQAGANASQLALLETAKQQLGQVAQSTSNILVESIMTAQVEQRSSSSMEQMRQIVLQEPNLETAIGQLQKQLDGKGQAEIEKAQQLLSSGRELSARQVLVDLVNQFEKESVQGQVYSNQEMFQTSAQPASKAIAVTTITEKVAIATEQFKQVQRELTRNLDAMVRLVDQFKHQAHHQVKPMLESTIHKLDQAILKSEMMMLTDMKTEKQLMQASGQLAEAKKLLQKGQYQEARQIVNDVKQVVERIQFKPSDTKVMHMLTAERNWQTNRTPQQQLAQQFVDTIRPPQEPSARQMFEMVRGMGLNRESEIGQMLSSSNSNRDFSQDSGNQRNVKAMLLQLMQSEQEGSRIAQQANQALSNITGQQLLSKPDPSSTQQTMLMQLPFLLQENVENLQVFVNSRNNGDQVDWENCNLYFLLETRKLGEIGILVTVQDRNLTITLKNDKDEFKNKMEPLVEQRVDNISEIGFTLNGIKFTKLAAEKAQTDGAQSINTETKQRPLFTEKGFDFKI